MACFDFVFHLILMFIKRFSFLGHYTYTNLFGNLQKNTANIIVLYVILCVIYNIKEKGVLPFSFVVEWGSR